MIPAVPAFLLLIVLEAVSFRFLPHGERVRSGLTTNIATLKVATHEYAAIWRDMRGATRWRHRAEYLVGHPGWQPAA